MYKAECETTVLVCTHNQSNMNHNLCQPHCHTTRLSMDHRWAHMCWHCHHVLAQSTLPVPMYAHSHGHTTPTLHHSWHHAPCLARAHPVIPADASTSRTRAWCRPCTLSKRLHRTALPLLCEKPSLNKVGVLHGPHSPASVCQCSCCYQPMMAHLPPASAGISWLKLSLNLLMFCSSCSTPASRLPLATNWPSTLLLPSAASPPAVS
jgi:hypothetical protein